MSKICKTILNILLKVLLGIVGAFVVTFVIYFFNLDMKFMAKFVDPILQKHYDKIPRKQYV